jgi:hypothetical protein
MPKSSRQIVEYSDEMAAALFEAYEPRAEDERDVAPFQALRRAGEQRAQAERAVRQAVADARAAKGSWARIGALLGTSGQAAQQRYGDVAR